MGALDKVDTLLSHRTEQHREVRNGIIFHLVLLALINSFTVYCQVGGKESLLSFQIEICRCLQKADKEVDSDEDMENPPRLKRSLKAKQISDQIRNDRVNHWSIKYDKRN